MTLQTLNRFMENSELNECFFLVIDSLESRYEGPTEKPVKEGSSADSPFIGKTPQECQALLGELQAKSPHLEISTRFFAILDDQSPDNVLLVDDYEEDFGTVRVAFELGMELLMCYVEALRSIAEDNSTAKWKYDGVLRDYDSGFV